MSTPDHREQLPDEGAASHEPDGLGAALRRALARGPTSEERLEGFLAERRRELEAQASRFDETIADLERREQLLSDSRASIERLLRLGTNDLEIRESDLAELVLELSEREAILSAAEADLTRRKGELGAVELRRAAVERQERALAAREERVSASEARLDEREPSSGSAVRPSQEDEIPSGLAFVPGARYRLLEVEPAEIATGRLELEGVEYVVARVGPSPLPGDSRRCAYLVQRLRAAPPPGGSL